MVVAAVLSFTGCYNDFDDPAPAKVWTEADFNKDQIITIKQLKMHKKYLRFRID